MHEGDARCIRSSVTWSGSRRRANSNRRDANIMFRTLPGAYPFAIIAVMTFYLRLALTCATFTLAPLVGRAQDVVFSRDILPILSDNCWQCHGPDPKTRKAKLRLDEEAGATADRGGSSAIVAGHPD